MARRQLVTIGDLTAARPLGRTRQRRQAMIGLVQGPYGMGAATSATAGEALQDAAMALLNKFDAQGVTPMGTADATVGDFQTAWNADPANASDQLADDSDYGPLTQGALNAIVGVAPAVNYGGNITPGPSPTPGTTPATTGGSSHLGLWLLLAAAGVGAYLLMRKKRRSGGGRRRAAPTIEVRTNPRRRIKGRRRNAELIP